MLNACDISYRRGLRDLIHKISLEFHPGVVYGIIGPNGSGKTTLLKNLSGIWKPSSGQVLWKGDSLLKKSRREISATISLVSQNTTVHFDYPVMEIVSMGCYPSSRGFRPHKIQHALETVDAWHLRDRRITEISHGEQQRIFIARALVTESPVLLLDEPTSNLDIRHQLEIWQLLTQLANQGKVVVVTNHDLGATERFCDQIAILEKGHCIAQGSYEDALTPERLQQVFGVVAETGTGTGTGIGITYQLSKIFF